MLWCKLQLWSSAPCNIELVTHKIWRYAPGNLYNVNWQMTLINLIWSAHDMDRNNCELATQSMGGLERIAAVTHIEMNAAVKP